MKKDKQQTEVKNTDEFSISVYLLALSSKYPGVKDYKEQAELLDAEFGIEIDEHELYLLDHQYDMQEDSEISLIYKNIGL